MAHRNSLSARIAALGIRVHSGWAVAVALAGSGESLKVVLRKKIELITSEVPKQPYHAAESLSLTKAEAFIVRSRDIVQRRAREELGSLIHDLDSSGFAVAAIGVLMASGRPLGTLAQTLASHAAIHTAEGEFYRNAVVEAGKHFGLPVTGVKERELFNRCSTRFGKPVEEIRKRVADLGASLGPPWRMDEKLSALVAWLVLADPLKP